MRTIAGNERYRVTLTISVSPGYELDLDEWERLLGIIIESGRTIPANPTKLSSDLEAR